MPKIIDWFYPVGAVVASVNSKFDPNKLYAHQTWVRFAKGQTLVGVNESDADFAAGESGGEKTHKLTVNEMPKHDHATVSENYGIGLRTALGSAGTNMGVFYGTGGHQTGTAGGSAAHNNLQPYVTVYYWKRTA